MKKVLVFGTFDFFHKGHESFLRQARKHGDNLVAVVARDKTVTEVKGRHPVNDEQARKKAVEKSGLADEVVLGNLGDKYLVLETQRPDAVCLGYDQTSFADGLRGELDKRGLVETEIFRLKPFKPETYKSSKLLKKLKDD